MPDLPQRKVGIVACSGEEMPEGLVTRLAALNVLEDLRPGETVTICLPLFLAGGEGDRAFARFYPTIAVDGCDKRCAARATELYSNKPAASYVVTDFVSERGLPQPRGLRRLDEGGWQVVSTLAATLAGAVDELLAVRWSRTKGEVLDMTPAEPAKVSDGGAFSCGSGIQVSYVAGGDRSVLFLALMPILDMAYGQGLRADGAAPPTLVETVRMYNPFPAAEEALYIEAIGLAWTDYCTQKGASR